MADSKDYEEKSPSHETVTVAMPSTESQSAQHRSITESAQFKVVTPKYKTGDKISSEINLGGATVSSGHTLRESNGEYRSEHSQEQFKMHVIDPKVNSNAYIPAHTTSSVVKTRTITEDFPSHHNKRSLLNLDPVEQRKFRSVETRPITTNAYLSESVNRHRAAEESKLKQYLKAKEGDANQPWNKPDWPGASQNQESLRELEQIRKSIETLQKVSAEPRTHDDLEELSRKSRELAERSKSRRSEFKLVGSEIVKTEPEAVPPPPQALKTSPKDQYSPGSVGTTTSAALHQLDRGSEYITDQSSATWQYNTHYNTPFSPRSVVSVNGNRRNDDGLLKIRTSQSVMNISRAEVETKPWPHMPADLDPVPDSPQSTLARQYHAERYSKVNHYNSMPALDTSASARGTTIQIQDEKQQQRVVMQPAEESESRSQLVRQTREVISSGKPRVTETIQRVEERKVTEETERRVLRRERKHRSHRSAHRSHHQSSGHQEAIGWHEGGGTGQPLTHYEESRSQHPSFEYIKEESLLLTTHRSSSASRGGSYYTAGNGYDRYGGYNPPPPPRDYPVGYHRGYEPTYYHTSYNGYDMPPAYPRRTASATLYH